MKRFFDFCLSTFVLIVLSPLFFIIALLVRINLGSPVLFIQKRPGKDEVIFNMFKFRSMSDCRDNEGKLLSDSERITKFGSFLRKSSLDELPSLWNIWRGDMSFVGPRPLLVEYLDYYTNQEKIRHSIRPGLTGLAQVSGRNNLGWNERLEIDIEYVKSKSFILDVKIILKTFVKVLKKEDVLVIPSQKFGKLSDERRKPQ